jgi:porphobilinogen synthase
MRRETRIDPAQLIQPLFVAENAQLTGPIDSMPGVRRFGIDEVGSAAAAVAESGVRAVLLFGIPAVKDATGSAAADPHGVVSQAIERIHREAPDVFVITDVCLCGYTAHGHCGLVEGGQVLNDESLAAHAGMAVAHADAGADMVAPSGMIDGAVAAIRAALDDSGHGNVAMLSYSVKFASSFYGPFRDAAHSAPAFGDRLSHQLDPANIREAIEEARQDAAEGADALMVKPAGPCLDVIRAVREAEPALPLAAYQVSGEYASLCAAAERGWLDLRATAMESLLAIRRAGADWVVSYFAQRAAQWIAEERETRR